VTAPARQAAFGALLSIERRRADLDAAVETARRGLDDPRDRALLHDLVTGTLRWQGRLDWRLAALVSTPWARLDAEVRVALRLGAYQLDHLDRLPDHAVVADAVSLVKTARKHSAAGLVNAVLRRIARGEGRPLPELTPELSGDALVHALAVVHAHPPWLVRRWLEREPRDVVEAWLAANLAPPPITLRVNPLIGGDRDEVARRLASAGVVATPSTRTPLGLVVERGLVATAPSILDGGCRLQDEGSQLAALLAPVLPGQRVLDVCAAPGGKTLAYVAAAGPTGRVVALDVRPRRLVTLAETLRLGGARSASIVQIGARHPLPVAPVFDVVAVDAPCSGLGTLGRDPDIKWRRTPEDLVDLQRVQIDLLRRAAGAVAPGGALVYTTCSTEPEEGTDVVAALLADTPGFALEPADAGPSARWLGPFTDADGLLRLHPARHRLDGYVGAVLRRVGGGRSRPSSVV
jgi:16S rRNA (cytosine967-C5)-methyltransferase